MNEAALMQNQLSSTATGTETPAQLYKMEKEFMDMMSHKYDLEHTETRLLAKFAKPN